MGPSLVVNRREFGRAEEDIDAGGDGSQPLQRDAQPAPDNPARTVATDQVVGGDGHFLSRFGIDQPGTNAGLKLVEGVQPGSVADGNRRQGFRLLGQNGIEIDLWARRRAFRRIIQIALAFPVGADLEPRQFFSDHGR